MADRHSGVPDCGCNACSSALRGHLARRGFMRVLSANVAGLALAPLLPEGARAAAKPTYQAMLLSCVDPRVQVPVAAWMEAPQPESHTTSLAGLYSQVTLAGASAAVVAPVFEAWHPAFWDNLGATIKLHGIRTLIVVDHGNCGAFGIAYGQALLGSPADELAKHVETTAALGKEVAARHPDLNYQAHYLHRDTAGGFTQWKTLVAGRAIG